MIRFQVQIAIDRDEEALDYHSVRFTEERLKRLVVDLVYQNTNTYPAEVEVSVVRLREHRNDT